MTTEQQSIYLPRGRVAERYHVSERTIIRWQADSRLGFPTPMVVHNRYFFAVFDLEAWERSRAAPSNQEAA